MQNVTEACSEKYVLRFFLQSYSIPVISSELFVRRCASQEANQTHYAECLQHEEVSMAYNLSIGNFLACVGDENPCLRLNLSISYGEDCWGKCSAQGYQRCLEK